MRLQILIGINALILGAGFLGMIFGIEGGRLGIAFRLLRFLGVALFPITMIALACSWIF